MTPLRSADAPRFRTLPPADVAYRSAQLQALVAEAFGARAAQQAPTCCLVCTWPIHSREDVARTVDGVVVHAECHAAVCHGCAP
jgi:hypothetical protein